jgi:hypothetical protein
MLDDIRDRYWPRELDEFVDDPVLIVNEPIHDDVTELRPGQRARALHAVIAENLAAVEHLLTRLEAGVCRANSGSAADQRLVCGLPTAAGVARCGATARAGVT